MNTSTQQKSEKSIQTLTLGHSPDPDDAFMFYALAHHKIPTGHYRFEHILQDIQTLNERARRCELDITAVSYHAYPYIAKDYALLTCGSSMGDGYGPMLITLKNYKPSDFPKLKIAIPGKLTSAFLSLKLYLHDSKIEVPESAFQLVPFDQIFDAVRSGKADVGLIIHEGQLTYEKAGFRLILDLGAWWKKETHLPLPLGGNVILKKLGTTCMKEAAKILSESIQYGLDHMDEALPHLKPYARDLDDSLTRRFVGMYVNEYTVDCMDSGRKSIELFLKRGAELKLVPEIKTLEFI